MRVSGFSRGPRDQKWSANLATELITAHGPTLLKEIIMRRILGVLLLSSVAACADPLTVEPIGSGEPMLGATTQANPNTSLVIETISGDCASGITVRVRGQNLSPKSRFGQQWLDLTNLTSLGPAEVALGRGPKKSVEWTVFWPAATINPSTGAKFNGYARGVVTDAYTGIVLQTAPTFIGPAC